MVFRFIYLFICKPRLQPWCNPLWLTGLKAPTNLLILRREFCYCCWTLFRYHLLRLNVVNTVCCYILLLLILLLLNIVVVAKTCGCWILMLLILLLLDATALNLHFVRASESLVVSTWSWIIITVLLHDEIQILQVVVKLTKKKSTRTW